MSIVHLTMAAVLALTAGAVPADEKPLPEGGVPLLPVNTAETFRYHGPQGAGGAQVVPAKGAGFAKAVRVRTAVRAERDYHVQLLAPSTADVARGDVCLLRFWARCVDGSDESGTGRARVYFQLNGPPHTKYVDYQATFGPQWTRFDVPFAMRAGRKAGQAALGIALGYKPQTVEVGGVRLLKYGDSVSVKDLPRTRQTYAGMAADAAWRSEAARRIDAHRKGDLTVRVVDAAGKPVAGAEVAVRMVRHEFGFGSAINLQDVAGGPEHKAYRRHIFELFNRVVNENDLKWPAWAGQWGDRFTKARSIEALELLRQRGLYVRGHCLVWPSWRHVPRSLAQLKDDPAALARAVREHIVEETSATKGLIDEWDVINEPYTNHDLMDVLGREIMVEWYQTAREVLPDTRLYINDYAILAAGGETDTRHQKHYEDTIRFLLDKGAPLGGIGLQSHFRQPLTPPETLWKILDRFARFGLPLQVTEFDVDTDDEELQAAYTRDFMTAVFAHPAVDGFVMWGFWEGRHWRPRAAMYRKDWTPKPNAKAYKDLVFKQWWTDESGRTDRDGRYATRAFRGEHTVRASAGGKSADAAVRIPRDGATITVKLP